VFGFGLVAEEHGAGVVHIGKDLGIVIRTAVEALSKNFPAFQVAEVINGKTYDQQDGSNDERKQ
jgi:hypothetical protein